MLYLECGLFLCTSDLHEALWSDTNFLIFGLQVPDYSTELESLFQCQQQENVSKRAARSEGIKYMLSNTSCREVWNVWKRCVWKYRKKIPPTECFTVARGITKVGEAPAGHCAILFSLK